MANAAMLVMDLQNDILSAYNEDTRNALIDKANRLIAQARQQGLPVIYIAVRFRENYPEVSPRNKLFSRIKQAGVLVEGTFGAAFHDRLDYHDNDITVVKRRVGAFSTTELETILRAHDVERLVMFGVATSGVILSTVRWAADRDYAMTVIGDVCADRDPEVHRLLTEKVLPAQADVMLMEDYLAQQG